MVTERAWRERQLLARGGCTTVAAAIRGVGHGADSAIARSIDNGPASTDIFRS
jgi:hypothetical protein